jgi:tRNA-specific 2-thiouridylase
MNKTRVVVAMSGGVDSSVAAALLKEQGYDVVGMALQVTDYSKYHKEGSKGTCCSLQDMDDARRVAEALQIPFYVVDTEKVFDANVVDYFVSEYADGRTPNPCAQCNTKVKFNALYKKAMDLDAEFIATGHFAKIENDPVLGYKLLRGQDENKDQSYFLFNLNQAQLSRTLFPVGDLTKQQVRELARKWNLPVAEKPESMEICFVPNNDYSKFIEERIATGEVQRKDGFIVTTSGAILGRHNGIHQFTVGQRKGLGPALETAQKMKINFDDLFVVELRADKNLVVLGSSAELQKSECRLDKVNWINDPSKLKSSRIEVKIRYRSQLAEADFIQDPSGDYILKFVTKQRAITPGQACVFFQDDCCLGGGWISA